MVSMFFRLTSSSIQYLCRAFKLEQSGGRESQVLENDPMAINLSQQVASMLCALVCTVFTLQGSVFVFVSFLSSPLNCGDGLWVSSSLTCRT